MAVAERKVQNERLERQGDKFTHLCRGVAGCSPALPKCVCKHMRHHQTSSPGIPQATQAVKEPGGENVNAEGSKDDSHGPEIP